jgi:hypothetical protein
MKISNDQAGYKKAVETLKRARRGMTAADLAAAAALPLPRARELISRAADEFRGRLRVTESSEILYDFPRGFTSRYSGPGARFGRFMDKFIALSLKCLSWAFKAWILVMLLGYFALFMLIALAALVLSMAGGSSSSNSRSRNNSGGGFFLAAHIFDLIIRLWFYSELTRSMEGGYRRSAARPRGKPLHKAVFSFVFGEKDPNEGADAAEKQALIEYLEANRGLIGLPEYMAVTGLAPAEAERGILAFCAEFGGSPEATEEGTIVYRFQDILLRAREPERAPNQSPEYAADRAADRPAASGPENLRRARVPLRRPRVFSSNGKSMNAWFAIINSVNLLFGSYFFYQALNTGILTTTAQLRAAPRLYGIAYYFLAKSITGNPRPLLLVGLGLVPLLFSFFFWLIPALRLVRLNGENQNIKKRNLRKTGFGKIWEKPRGLAAADIDGPAPECRPANLEAERERIIVEMGTYSQPGVEVDESGRTVYNFTELEREKAALAAGRAAVNPEDFRIGRVIFDSE